MTTTPSGTASHRAGEWSTLLRRFATATRVAGVGEATLERRLRHMEQLAEYCEISANDVRREDIADWIRSRNVSEGTQRSMADSARAFYRWAYEGQYVSHNPSEHSRRASRAAAVPHWEAEIQAWEKSLRGVGRSESTIRQLGTYLRNFAASHEHRSPWDLTTDEMLEWFSTKRWKPETRRGRRSALRSFYRWAKDSGRAGKNPAKKLPVMRGDAGVPRPAADDDLTIALAVADERERLALWIAAELGLRCAEVAQVHGSDLRQKDGGWWLLVHGKGAKERLVPVPEPLARAIHSRGSQHLFPGQVDGHVSPHYLGKRVNAVLPDGVTMHMLRHRFATIAYDADRDTFAVQRLLGHASPATTQRYVQIGDDTLRRTVDAVHRHRGGLDEALHELRMAQAAS